MDLDAAAHIESDATLAPAPTPFWKTLIRCNPFYLLSAVLLIYGVYRASIDPRFLSTENLQVIFNFGSLEIYGLMLVVTAIFLSHQKIWYDATLLLFLENVLVLVPFILISHAVFLDASMAQTMSLLAFGLAAAKFGAFKTFFAGLNLPRRLLVVGALVLIVNTAIPLVFRKGLDTDNELWLMRSQYCWFVLLPILALAGNVLSPLPGKPPVTDEHRKPWLPLATFLLWIAGTAAHLYSVGYVDDQKFEVARFSVLAWAITWLLCAKITLRMSRFTPHAPEIMLGLPIAASFLALERPEIAVTLNILNAMVFAILCLRWKSYRLPATLGGLSLLAALLLVPSEWIIPVVSGYSKGVLVFALVNAALIFNAVRTRTAKWGFIGAVSLAVTILAAGRFTRGIEHIAVQFGCVFLLLHSFFWSGPQERGSVLALVLAGGIWTLDSYFLSRGDGWLLRCMPYLTALPMLLFAWVFRRSLLVGVSAGLVLVVAPVAHAATAFQNAPAGVVALGTSFLLFGLGTAFAIGRRRFSA